MDKITADMAGTWLDGAMGWHNNYRIIDLAIDYGWVPEDGFPMVTRIRDAYADSEDYILDVTEGKIYPGDAILNQGGYADQATEYLQSLAPEGYEFAWDAGEFYLAPIDESEGY